MLGCSEVLVCWMMARSISVLQDALWAFYIPYIQQTCQPKPNVALTQYLIGYGSLMQEESKLETYKDAGPSYPIYLKGFKRGWFQRTLSIGFSTTYLGAEISKDSMLNAVYFQLKDSKSLTLYDIREKNYCRVKVKPEQIQPLMGRPVLAGEYWIYVVDKKNQYQPSSQYPIVQSYVDIFLSGCMQLENRYHLNNFVKNCIKMTSGWSSHWVNDRIYPRRPFNKQPYASLIDSLLFKELPQFYKQVKIE